MGSSRTWLQSILGRSKEKTLSTSESISTTVGQSLLIKEFPAEPVDSLMPDNHQRALILNGVKQPYETIEKHPVPQIESSREILVRNTVIGLNPIDWKALPENVIAEIQGFPVIDFVWY